ncbi:hypothetical protein D3C87_1199810 [compost metagenome]
MTSCPIRPIVQVRNIASAPAVMLGNRPRDCNSLRASIVPPKSTANATPVYTANVRKTSFGLEGRSSVATYGVASSPATASTISALIWRCQERSVMSSSATPASIASAGKIGTM